MKEKKSPLVGKPQKGTARFLTPDEAKEVGLTETCIVVCDSRGIVSVLMNNSEGWTEIQDDAYWVLGELEKMWSKRGDVSPLLTVDSDNYD